MKTLNPKFKGAVCSSLDEVVYLNQKNFKNFSFHISNEFLKTSPVVFYFPKHTFLVNTMNDKVSLLKSAGLIDFWVSRHMNRRYAKIKAAVLGPRKLNFYQLSGILSVWCGGCVGSFIIFIFELLCYKFKCCVQF